MDAKTIISEGKAILGMELGSTRIKAVLTDSAGHVLATGAYDWENSLVDGVWTYELSQAREGIRGCYASLRKEVEETYGVTPASYAAIGVSAMMHGYLPFDAHGKQLSRFQTWRNTNTQEAADILTETFQFNIPLRWSIAHLYQRILDGEEHVKDLDYLSTLPGYTHWILTGQKAVGLNEASGMFPIDPKTLDYDERMVQAFDALIADKGYPWKLRDVLPKIYAAGDVAGTLTEEGAALLDDSGTLRAGIPFCPPEGDGGTGMIATNTIVPRTGSISVGTSTFAMIVIEKELTKVYRELDVMMTPDGALLAQSHGNNGTTDLNAWVALFREFASLIGKDLDAGEAFEALYRHSLEGDADCDGMLSYCFLAGESLAGVNDGRPLFVRMPESRMTLANFIKTHLYANLAVVKMGLDILKNDGAVIERILGHGGFFKTKEVGQKALAAAVGAPVTVMDTAGEGGAWGIALLAGYMAAKQGGSALSLVEFLDQQIFVELSGTTLEATQEEIDGFEKYMQRYVRALAAEKAAAESMVD